MKIVHVMSYYMPNMGYQENFLPSEQRKLGHDVEIITGNVAPPFSDLISSGAAEAKLERGSFIDNGVRIYRLPSIVIGGQVVLFGLSRKLKELKPDVVHAHVSLAPSTLQAIMLSKRSKFKLFVDDHSNRDNFHAYSMFSRVYVSAARQIHRRAQDSVHKYLPVTKASFDFLKSELDLDPSRFELLPLGADSSKFFHSPSLRQEGRAELGIDDDTILVLSSGKFGPKKEVLTLLRAFSKLRERYPNIQLALVGRGPSDYLAKMKELTRSENMEGSVHFIDFVPNDQLPRYYNAADIGVWPGDASITVLEAASTGIHIVIPQGDDSYQLLYQLPKVEMFQRGSDQSLFRTIADIIPNVGNEGGEKYHGNTFVSKLSWKSIALDSIRIYESTA